MHCTYLRVFASSPRLLAAVGGSLVFLAAGQAQTAVQLSPEVVTAARTAQPPEQVAATLKTLDDAALRQVPTATLDGALRSVPGFTLFRRSDSFTANPTAQGVSLRGLGPSGASRSLVLLDGVPLNDPFGGWVAWTKVPREGLRQIELVPGGGASAWGNAALGGVVQVLSADGTGALPNRAVGIIGDYGTRSGEVAQNFAYGDGGVQLRGRIFSTDGFSLVAPERRGSIDIPAWSRHRWASAGWTHSFGAKLQLGADARYYEEKRGNGTPYQQNDSREKFLSLRAAGELTPTFSWAAIGYAQDQTFASTFSAVNATRTAETPASDQFDVPSEAYGAAWTGLWRGEIAGRQTRTSFGADARWVSGETRENFTFANGDFTRQRVAGGEQQVAGLFLLHEQPLPANLIATLGGRFDGWEETDGHRRETDRTNGAVLRDDRYADRDGTAFTPSAGLVWHPTAEWRVRGNVQKGFRRPTLNELYRPFRVGANVTEANAALDTERVVSSEVGVEWTRWANEAASAAATSAPAGSFAGVAGAIAPRRRALLTLGAVAFRNDLRDAVGNVTIARGPGTFPIVGFVAAGGVGRQRLSLDRTRVEGVELSARWQPTAALALNAEFLYNDATVTRAPIAPALEGKRLAQVPRQAGTLGAVIALPARFTLAPRVRWIGRQFEDDENQLILGEVVIADLGLSRPVGRNLELFVNVENIGDARIETGRSADGIVNVGTPRLALFGVRGSW